MKKNLLFVISLIFILTACPNTDNPAPIPVNDGIEHCQAAEKHLKEKGCIPSDRPYTLKGKSFSQFCTETMKNGIDLRPACLSQINSCDQMNKCVQQ